MTRDDKEIVSALRAQLIGRVGRDRYEVWFGPNTDLFVADGTLTVVVPNRFFQDWLRTNFRKELESACKEVTGEALAIEFRVDETRAIADVATTGTDDAAAQATPARGSNGLMAKSVAMNADAAALKLTSSQTNGNTAADARPRRKFSCLTSFVSGDSNRLAHQSALLATREPGKMSPLFVYGPSGVGKTHLLEGIWSGLKRSHRYGPTLYLSAEQFTTYFQEALHGSGLPSFRRKYRGVDTLLVDDIQFFIGKRATIGELLHTVDTLLRDGRQLVLAADRAPAALKALGPELTARITSGVICKIDLPEYDTRLGIVRRLVEQMELSVPDDVQQYVAAHFTAHARELSGALKRLHATSLAHGRNISLRMAEEALADLIHHNGRVVRLGDIEKAVCEVFGLEVESLQSARKGKSVAHPRMLAMWLARKHTRSALSEIGHYFGGRTHSTVISAQKKINTWMAKGKSLDTPQRVWKLDDAIRRVEESLRASG